MNAHTPTAENARTNRVQARTALPWTIVAPVLLAQAVSSAG
jgi:hypothetical protein